MPDDFEHVNDGVDGRRIFRVYPVKCVGHAPGSVDHEVQVGTVLLRGQNLVATQAGIGHWRATLTGVRDVEVSTAGAHVVMSRRIGWPLAASAAPQ